MKSSPETRTRFKERIVKALHSMPDSDDLSEALAIVNDLEDCIDNSALFAEYLHQKNIDEADRWYDDDSADEAPYNTDKMRTFIIHRLDLFLNTGVNAGDWRNTNHWIAVAVKKLANIADGINFGFKNPAYRNPSGALISQASAPALSQFTIDLKRQMQHSFSVAQQQSLVMSQKSNGRIHIKTSKAEVYLEHTYVISEVKLWRVGGPKLKFIDTDWKAILDVIKSMLF